MEISSLATFCSESQRTSTISKVPLPSQRRWWAVRWVRQMCSLAQAKTAWTTPGNSSRISCNSRAVSTLAMSKCSIWSISASPRDIWIQMGNYCLKRFWKIFVAPLNMQVWTSWMAWVISIHNFTPNLYRHLSERRSWSHLLHDGDPLQDQVIQAISPQEKAPVRHRLAQATRHNPSIGSEHEGEQAARVTEGTHAHQRP